MADNGVTAVVSMAMDGAGNATSNEDGEKE